MHKLLYLFPLLLCACSGSSSNSNPISKKSEPIKLELGSPDQAVKTWWKVRDGLDAFGSDTCEKRAKSYKESDPYRNGAAMTTGAARLGFDPTSSCDLETYSREIVEVKVESETRAVVLAKIKPTTPVPAGASPDAADLKRRNEGAPYKYVLEKVGSEWKIAQVYSYESFRESDPWLPAFAEHPTPRIHTYVGGIQ